MMIAMINTIPAIPIIATIPTANPFKVSGSTNGKITPVGLKYWFLKRKAEAGPIRTSEVDNIVITKYEIIFFRVAFAKINCKCSKTFDGRWSIKIPKLPRNIFGLDKHFVHIGRNLFIFMFSLVEDFSMTLSAEILSTLLRNRLPTLNTILRKL